MWNGVLQFIVSLIAVVTYVTVLWNLSFFPLAFTLFGVATSRFPATWSGRRRSMC